MLIHQNECDAAGLEYKEVRRITKGLSNYAKQAEKLGLLVFGGTGDGSLRFSEQGKGDLVVASLDGVFSGGDGACSEDEDGLLRGEY